METGIHLGLSNEDYHKDEAIGSTSIRQSASVLQICILTPLNEVNPRRLSRQFTRHYWRRWYLKRISLYYQTSRIGGRQSTRTH